MGVDDYYGTVFKLSKPAYKWVETVRGTSSPQVSFPWVRLIGGFAVPIPEDARVVHWSPTSSCEASVSAS